MAAKLQKDGLPNPNGTTISWSTILTSNLSDDNLKTLPAILNTSPQYLVHVQELKTQTLKINALKVKSTAR